MQNKKNMRVKYPTKRNTVNLGIVSYSYTRGRHTI